MVTIDDLLTKDNLIQIIKNIPAAIAIFDKEMKYMAVSDRWISGYGLKDPDVLGKSHYEIFPNISDEWKELHRKALNGEVLEKDLDEFQREDGRTDYITWLITPWKDENNEIGGIIMFTQVITDLINLQKELEKKIEDLEAINKTMVGRELKMIELKKELEEKLKQANGGSQD